MADLWDWFNTGIGNDTGASPDYPYEGWTPAEVNEVMREQFAALRRFYNDSEWREVGDGTTDPTVSVATATITVAGADYTALFPIGTPIKTTGGATEYGIVTTTPAFSTNTTFNIQVYDGSTPPVLGNPTAGVTEIYYHQSRELGPLAFLQKAGNGNMGELVAGALLYANTGADDVLSLDPSGTSRALVQSTTGGDGYETGQEPSVSDARRAVRVNEAGDDFEFGEAERYYTALTGGDNAGFAPLSGGTGVTAWEDNAASVLRAQVVNGDGTKKYRVNFSGTVLQQNSTSGLWIHVYVGATGDATDTEVWRTAMQFHTAGVAYPLSVSGLQVQPSANHYVTIALTTFTSTGEITLYNTATNFFPFLEVTEIFE